MLPSRRCSAPHRLHAFGVLSCLLLLLAGCEGAPRDEAPPGSAELPSTAPEDRGPAAAPGLPPQPPQPQQQAATPAPAQQVVPPDPDALESAQVDAPGPSKVKPPKKRSASKPRPAAAAGDRPPPEEGKKDDGASSPDLAVAPLGPAAPNGGSAPGDDEARALRELVVALRSEAVVAASAASAAATPSAGAAGGLQPGKIAWNTPPAMRMGESAEVELRVTLDEARFEGLEARVRAPGTTTAERVELAPRLSAKLESTAFDIKPDGLQRQTVRPGRDAAWQWIISPKMKGEHKLLLTLISQPEEGEVVEPIVRTIRVSAAEGEDRARVIDWIAQHWEKLLTLVLIPVGGYLVKVFHDRKGKT